MSNEDKPIPGGFIEEGFMDDVVFDDELEEIDQEGLLDEFSHPRFDVEEGRNDVETVSAVRNEPIVVSDEEPELEVEPVAPGSLTSSEGEPKIGAHSGRGFPARLFYGCNLCDFSSLQETDLKKHKVVHAGQEPFSCGQCDYHCREEYELEIHRAMHKAETLLACDLCSYRCSNEDNLKEHKMSHARNCDSRSGIVLQNDGFHQHYLSHTREKLFSCDICIHLTQDEKDLEIHKKTHNEIQPSEVLYICDHCDYFCEDEKFLEEHQMCHITGGLHYLWYR